MTEKLISDGLALLDLDPDGVGHLRLNRPEASNGMDVPFLRALYDAVMAAHGEPRLGAVDLIDWIERIPFDETRDYVERVSENLGVYRQRFADEPPTPAQVSAFVARE